MKLLIDLNLTPAWCRFLAEHGIEALHWSTVGDPRAPDSELMSWARAEGYVVFTHDLDFGALLALTAARGPSVLQVRTSDVLPDHIGTLVLDVLRQFEPALTAGALVTVDERRTRARILPIRG